MHNPILDNAILYAVTSIQNGKDFDEAVEDAAEQFGVSAPLVHTETEKVIDNYHEGYEPITGRK